MFTRGRLLQGLELTIQQRRRPEMVTTQCGPPGDQLLVPLQIDQDHVRPRTDQDIAIGALKRGAGHRNRDATDVPAACLSSYRVQPRASVLLIIASASIAYSMPPRIIFTK